MDTIKKLQILSEDSQYDLACACGTGKDDRRHRGIDGKWLYPVTLPNGGNSIMLKTLLSNCCSSDCKYCPLRNDTNINRCSLNPEETAKVFMDYYRHRKVFGMFLSSGVINNPDYTMDKINSVAAILRKKYKFKGYLHLKIIPGASNAAIEETMSLASAVSVNIETPGEGHFNKLSEKKNYLSDIVRPLKFIGNQIAHNRKFSRIKTSTQFIVGASDEADNEIIKYSFGLYRKLNMDRIYFSAYQAGLGKSDIPGENFKLSNDEHFVREHRLYQSDFLIRQYGFEIEDFFYEMDGSLSLDKDPKQVWADYHTEYFPININKADKEELLRIPGIGPISVKRIIKLRKIHTLKSLADVGVKGKLFEKASNYVKY
jgi:predicted DNA-binding helix-hairpin-helix protein